MKRLFLLALCLPIFARADFHKRCVEHYDRMSEFIWDSRSLAKGDILTIPTRHIYATQRRFAQRVVQENLENTPREKAIQVVIWNDRAYALDGHHKLMTNIMLDRAESEIEVLYNFSGLSEEAFREQMRDLAYVEDEAHGPDAINPCDMRNDPYLYLVRMFILRASVDDNGEVKLGRGATQPLVVKINGGPTYSELRMADDMNTAGIKYKPKWGEKFKGGITRKIRRVLENSEWMTEQTHLMVLPKRMRSDDPTLITAVREFWEDVDEPCSTGLKPRMPKVSSGERQ